MKKLFIVIILMTLMGSMCESEGPNCHFSIIILNNSSSDIIPALRFINTSNKCILSGSILKPSESYELRMRDCWEHVLANGRTQEIYIVDPNNFNTPTVFYNCDSIEIKNTVLKYYSVKLSDIKNSDYTITYE